MRSKQKNPVVVLTPILKNTEKNKNTAAKITKRRSTVTFNEPSGGKDSPEKPAKIQRRRLTVDQPSANQSAENQLREENMFLRNKVKKVEQDYQQQVNKLSKDLNDAVTKYKKKIHDLKATNAELTKKQEIQYEKMFSVMKTNAQISKEALKAKNDLINACLVTPTSDYEPDSSLITKQDDPLEIEYSETSDYEDTNFVPEANEVYEYGVIDHGNQGKENKLDMFIKINISKYFFFFRVLVHRNGLAA